MKMKSIFVSMLAVVALASCNKEEAGGAPQVDPNYTGAYLSVGISMPHAEGSRAAAPGTDAGSAKESEIKSIRVVGFKDDAYLTKVGVYSIATISDAEAAFPVSGDVKKILVVINPSPKAELAINTAPTYAAMNLAITEAAADLSEGLSGFMMTSAGVVPGDKGLVAVTPSVAQTENPTDISNAKAQALLNKVSVSVDRTVAKVALKPFTATLTNVANGTAEILGWQTNTTTKEYFPYAELITYNQNDAKYRVDPTWDKQPAANFNWLKNNMNPYEADNTQSINWLTPSVATNPVAYCLENTMNTTAMNYNNTTKATIKAKFAPVGVVLGQSWYRVSGVVKTLVELKADYKAAETTLASDATNAAALALRSAFDAFKAKLGMAAVPFANLNEATMDLVLNGGYKAATAEGCMIEYFQKSLCYYNVNIHHDQRIAAFGLGRWGVVRNNSYTLTVDKITQAGSPYIPDPTDPDIKDPNNPKPESPEDNDSASAFISVTISMNKWATWDQNIEL